MSLNLTTSYLGMSLKNPLIVGACPLTGSLTMLPRLEEAGAAAVVLPSLFEEQIQFQDAEVYHQYDRCADFDRRVDDGSEMSSVIPELLDYNSGPDSYLRLVEFAKRSVRIPVIASLNGTSPGNWVRYAKLIEEAGADALELNICYLATDPDLAASQVEDRVVEIVSAVRQQVAMPLAVKIGPFYTALSNVARRLVGAGADGLVLFNRFLDADIDIELQRAEPRMLLSQHHELRLPLRWIAILRDQLPISLCATSGIHSAADIIRAILAGADAVMMVSTLLRHGPDHLLILHQELAAWLHEHEYQSLAELRGNLSMGRCTDPSAIERACYLKIVTAPVERAQWEER